MTTTINASPSNGLVQSADGSGILKVQSNGVTTNALAWANFAGATGTIASSYNVSSITQNGTGDYTANFTTAMANVNYVTVGGVTVSGSTTTLLTNVLFADSASAYGVKSTTQLQMFTYAAAFVNPAQVSFAIFGN